MSKFLEPLYTITPVNDPPVAADDSGPNFATNEDTVLASSNVPANIIADVPEAATYQLVYALTNIPANADYDGALPPYSTNNAANVGTFSRVAYYLELDNGSGRRWVYVSMDAFTTDPLRIGVPVGSIAFQQKVTNMNVASNASGVTTGTNIATGNIEFWSNCYDKVLGLGTIGGSSSAYDFNDTRTIASPSCYGSMQVHNYGTSQTILAYNAWDENGADEIGIGNAPSSDIDWTFARNAGTYTVRNLYVLASGVPSVLQNDSDADNDPLTVSAFDATSAQGATVTMQPNGSFTYDPRPSASLNALDTGENVVDTFTYTATDGIASDSATVSIIVNGVNDAPVASNGSLTTNEDTTANGTLVASDVDVEPLTYSIVTNGTKGVATITDASTGAFTYTPNANANGSDNFTFRANDGTADSNVATVTITITPVNDAPVNSGPGAGISSFTNAATITIPDSGAASPYPSTITIAGASTSVNNLTVTLTNINHTFPDDLDILLVGPAGKSVLLMSDAGSSADLVNQTLTFDDAAAATLPDSTQIASGSYRPSNYGSGDTFPAPAPAPAPPYGSTLAVFNGSNPNGDWKLYVVDDASSDSGNIAGGWTLNINSGVTTNEDTPVTLGAASVLVSVSDVDAGSNPLLVTLATSDGTLTLNGTAGLSGSGSGSGSLSYSGTLADLNTALDGMIFTPAPDFNGVASVYMTSDDQGATGGPAQTDSDTYFITVTSVNDAPSFTAGANQTVAEDAGPQIVSGWATSISAGPADESGQTISFLVTNDNAALFSGVPTIAPDGTLTYTPAPDAFGSATVTVQAQDDGGTANGGSDTSPVQTFTITITPVNDAPVATDDSYSVLEDGSITSSAATGVLANDSDVDGDPLTAILVSTTSNGTLTLNPDGSFAYTPNGDFNGSDSFTYTANDGTTDSNVATVTITVASVNDAPVAVDDSASTPEDTPLTVAAPGVLANDTDVDGDPLTATVVSTTSNGTLTLNADGSFSYTPAANFTGTDSFTYKANDGTTDSNIAMVTITVAAVNDAPVATDNSYTTDEDTPLTVTAPGVLANDTDVDGDPLTAILVSTTSNGTLTLNADGSFSYTPAANFNGTDSFTYTANDGTTDSNVATVTITITAVNDAPVNSVPGAQTANEDTDLIFSPGNGNAMSISDLDAGSGAVQVTLSAGNGTLTLAGSTGLSFTVGDGTNDATLTFTGTIADSNAALDGLRYTPSAGYNGSDTLSITTDDQGNTGTGGALSDSDSVAISVAAINDAPSFTSGANEIVAEDAGPQTVSGWATNISPGPADESGQTISFGVTNDNPALFSVDPTIAPDGTLTYTPAPDAFGSATVTVQAQDNGGTANGGNDTSPAQTFTITVTPVNDPPVASDDTLITDEDTAASGTLVATDVDDNALTYSIVANGTQGSVTITDASTGAFTYTPDPDANGSDSFTYTANDGTDDSNVATVTITVTSVNDAPSFTTGANEIVAEDAGPQSVSGWATSISPGPADEITQTVSFSVTNDNPALFSVDPTIAPDGTLTYTPAPDAFGSATVTVQAQDDGGTANGGSDTSPAQTFTITITAVNDAPVTTDDSYTAAEDSTLTVAAASGVLQNDSDVDGDPLTATVVSSTSNGTLTLNTDGSFSYTPDADYTGTDSFTYTANDGNGGTATATVTITVTMLGDAPVASDSNLTTTEDTPASGTLIAIDADGDPLTYTLVTNGTQGGVTITDPSSGAFTYTPDADANGSDSFTFQVNDGINDSNVATVTITITPVNDAPVASDGTLTTVENTTASGTLQATDVDGDALTYAIVANGTQGSVTITNASSGTFTYTPNPGVSGNDSFTFQVNDGTLDSNVATVTITITPSAVVPPTDTTTRLYLPLLQRAPALPELPDLVVESIRVQDGALQVIIANQGGHAVTQPFWVDAYLNPTSAPTAVNQTWPLLGDRGLAWGVRGDALPLAPGARVTLTVGDSAYVAAKSNPGGTLASGSTVYVQVDSASIGSPYGAVDEADEQDGGTYNNIARLVVETDVVLPASAPATTQAAPTSHLPLRPE